MNARLHGVIGELEDCERSRCAAIVAGDRAALGMLLDDALVHVHGTGVIDDKAGYLQGIGGKYRFHFVERGPLMFRAAGAAMVMVGTLSQSFTEIASDARYAVKGIVTQVWVQANDACWRQISCHNSFVETVREP